MSEERKCEKCQSPTKIWWITEGKKLCNSCFHEEIDDKEILMAPWWGRFG
jgi:hypothetical protein